MSTSYDYHTIFKGELNENDEDEELDMAEFDSKVFSLQEDINRIEPNRDPRLETEYLGNNGECEIHFTFFTSWMDREADIEDYLDHVQDELENQLDIIIIERDNLGYSRRQ
ncbi:MAG: hypothetical protein INQ03_15075 [Candidatus Heimdallarchaeota archaeon]|nr:hypothetical protein [Candidatus Heimdallarchaeota archaeon]